MVISSIITIFTYPNKLKVINMLQSEFKERTGVDVTLDEYRAIEVVYINSDLDKDEFCKMWCKMNASRVVKAKIDSKEKEEYNNLRNALHAIAKKLSLKAMQDNCKSHPLTIAFLSHKELCLLDKAAIRIQMSEEKSNEYGYSFQRFYDISETAYHIKKYLKIV